MSGALSLHRCGRTKRLPEEDRSAQLGAEFGIPWEIDVGADIDMLNQIVTVYYHPTDDLDFWPVPCGARAFEGRLVVQLLEEPSTTSDRWART